MPIPRAGRTRAAGPQTTKAAHGGLRQCNL